MANLYKNKVIYNGQTLIDLTGVTVTPQVLSQGYTAIDASGAPIVGTMSGGGGSSWTKVAETTYTVSTSSTSAITVATWATGHSEIWTSDKIVYVRIRDTVGKRAGYFYGTDTFFINPFIKNGSSTTSTQSRSISAIWSVDSHSLYNFRYGYNSTSYGVYPDYFFDNGDIRISERYNRAYTLTIDSTYKVEVYLLDMPTGAPIFT